MNLAHSPDRFLSAVQVGITHIGILTGAFGEGLLTHHDVLEAIAGDIPIGDKKAEPRAVQREDGSWLMLRGSGTEPILRIYAESNSDRAAQALLKLGIGLTKQV